MENALVYNRYFKNKEAIIFDLDDTIYKELDYLRYAYKSISEDIEERFKIPAIDTYTFLYDGFQKEGREKLFNKLFDKFKLPSSYMDTALQLMREVKVNEKLDCNKLVVDIIANCINDNKWLFIITNGNVVQQKNKLDSLGLDGIIEKIKIIYANEYTPKPDPAAFLALKGSFEISSQACIMVGDSAVDEQFARACGIDFLNVRDLNSEH